MDRGAASSESVEIDRLRHHGVTRILVLRR
jgi:hypothetical protein